MMSDRTQYFVSLATYEDLPSLASVFRAAFNDNPHTLSYWLFPQNDQEANYNWRLSEMRHRYRSDSDCRYYKLSDVRTDQVIGLSVWQVPSPPQNDEEKAIKEANDDDFANTQVLPQGTKRQLLDDFTLETSRMRAKHVDSEKDYGELRLRHILSHISQCNAGFAQS